MSSLCWKEQIPGSQYALSGDMIVGMIGQRSDAPGRWWWQIAAVHTKHIVAGSGEVRSAGAARKAVEKAWAAWLRHASLVPLEKAPENR